ncbi:MAG: hypothetical protein COB50_03770 [Thiotrichales bacterium]|nr:MAG: hypothetical protein COB50_03770 [Thiotrichales bacterium]
MAFPIIRLLELSGSDIQQCLAIYSHSVKHTYASFEISPPSIEEFTARVKKVTGTYPWLVCAIGGQIVGYAYASNFNSRSAYKWSTELSVYNDPTIHGQGIGKALYSALLMIVKSQGFYRAIAGISLPNPASIKLHESFGFSQVGVYRNVGFKQKEWRDVGTYQLELKKPSNCPLPVKLINKLADNLLSSVFTKATNLIKNTIFDLTLNNSINYQFQKKKLTVENSENKIEQSCKKKSDFCKKSTKLNIEFKQLELTTSNHEAKEEYFLKSTRLGFRQWKKNDLKLAIGLWGDINVTKAFDARGKLSDEEVGKRLTKEISTHNSSNVQYWPIFLLENDKHIGACGLRPYGNVAEKIYEIGFHIRSDCWRRGFAYEAACAVIQYAFKTLKAKGLFAGHHPNNKGSRQLLSKLGFGYTHDEYYEPTGLKHPSYVLSANSYKKKPLFYRNSNPIQKIASALNHSAKLSTPSTNTDKIGGSVNS